MPFRVLVSDALSPAALEIFERRGINVDFLPELGKDREALVKIIGDYDALAVRSTTRVDAALFERARRLKVVGRAGAGVDNIDVQAATARGVVVMNAPFGNSITTAEHTIALLFALARQIPAADASTRAGKWEKNRFMGVEIAGKTLGLIGCGNVGSNVAKRALGLEMRIVVYDPFLSQERAKDIGAERVELDDLLARADFISLHTPLTAATRNILGAENIAKTKKGVRIINCARGGLLDEEALGRALDSGRVAGAALDVFAVEPAVQNPLFARANVVCTPHLGASTIEAQEKVALQIADQICDCLLRGAIANAVNFPSITVEEAPRIRPFVELGGKLGSFAGQLARTTIAKITIVYEGAVAQQKTKAITASAIAGVLRPFLAEVNIISSSAIAKERGIVVEEATRELDGDYESLTRLTVTTADGEVSLAGTVFHNGRPRIVAVNGIEVEAEFSPSMIFVSNEDKPGFIGRFAGLLGEAGINIATFALGRDRPGGFAVALVAVDGEVPSGAVAAISALPGVRRASALAF